jgi:hypothetical protein
MLADRYTPLLALKRPTLVDGQAMVEVAARALLYRTRGISEMLMLWVVEA